MAVLIQERFARWANLLEVTYNHFGVYKCKLMWHGHVRYFDVHSTIVDRMGGDQGRFSAFDAIVSEHLDEMKRVEEVVKALEGT